MSAASTHSQAYAEPLEPAPIASPPAAVPPPKPAWFSESGSAMLAVLLLVIGGYAAVLAGWTAPPVVQLAFAFAGLALIPGFALASYLLREDDAELPEWIAAAFGLGIAVHAVFAFACHLTGTDFRIGQWVLPGLGLAVLLVRFGRGRSSPVDGRLPMSAYGAWLVAALAVAAAAVWAGINGAPLAVDNDSYDHIAAVGRMATSGVVFPHDAYFADAGLSGADPRKGLYHALVALVVHVTRLDPVVVWKLAAALLAPILILAAYALARRVTQKRAAGAVAAVLMLFVYGGGLGSMALREAPYSTRVADALSVLTVWALLGFLTGGGRRRLVLVLALAFAAVTTHVFSAVYLALAGVALVIGVALGYRHLPAAVHVASRGRWLVMAVGTGLSMAAVCAPYLVMRWKEAYAPADPIHLEPQGLLFWLGDALYTVSPWPIWEWLGWPGLALVLTLPFLWSRRQLGLGPVYLVSSTVAVLLIVFNPFAVPLAHQILGYLVMRLVWCVPVAAGLSASIVLAVSSLRGKEPAWVRSQARFALVAGGLALVPAMVSTATAVLQQPQRRQAEEHRGSGAWLDLIAFLRHHWDGPRVLLADPPTSYSLAAYTRHYVTTLMPQHASPNDPDGERRLGDVRDVLSPFVDDRGTLEILRRYDVDAVVVNQRHRGAFAVGPWVNQPELYGQVLEKFRRRPDYFDETWSAEGASVFELTPEAKSGALPDPARRIALPSASGTTSGGEGTVLDGDFRQYGTVVEPAATRAGGAISLVTTWSRSPGTELEPGEYWVALRLESDVPESALYHPIVAKPYRKAMELISGETWKFGSNHVPLDGYLAPDRWPERQRFEDRYSFTIPANAAPGEYRIRVKMMRTPHYPNRRIEEFLLDHDDSDGEVVATVRVDEAR